MTSVFSPPAGTKGLILSALAFWGATLVVNGLIFSLGLNDRPMATADGVLPPGYVIGSVWSLLFAAMGVAYWRVVHRPTPVWPETSRPQGHILAFAGFCLAYPVFTLGFSIGPLVVAGNLVCIAWSSALAGYFAPKLRLVAGLIFMPAVWVMYVTYLIAVTAMV
ncbi:MAG: tryptophan-rich sensory protein [Parvibaculales bacterium]